MQVTSLISRNDVTSGACQNHDHDHDHDHDRDSQHTHHHGHDHGHEHIPVHMTQTILGLILVINSFVVEWFYGKGNMVAGLSAMLGTVIMAYPILMTAFKDIRRGLLTVNELVAIAVLAAFASGDYQTAGVVSFFMLLGE
ncbi:MAG TPA: hypothetical protein P5055_16480, partial [Candidatus Paceibacterota bacterium]|nr:hypothetical protein [Candidatus Paceibacterota bacterium]